MNPNRQEFLRFCRVLTRQAGGAEVRFVPPLAGMRLAIHWIKTFGWRP